MDIRTEVAFLITLESGLEFTEWQVLWGFEKGFQRISERRKVIEKRSNVASVRVVKLVAKDRPSRP